MTEHPARQILVATDFSDSAEAALGVAVRYARELHARLHLLHVSWEGEVEVTQLLADAAAQAGPDVPVTVAGAGGDPVPSGVAPAAQETASPAPARRCVVCAKPSGDLSELIFLKDSERLVLPEAFVTVYAATPELTARLRGGRIDPARTALRADPKAVTFHQFGLVRLRYLSIAARNAAKFRFDLFESMDRPMH